VGVTATVPVTVPVTIVVGTGEVMAVLQEKTRIWRCRSFVGVDGRCLE
jgi:hypothetical protein